MVKLTNAVKPDERVHIVLPLLEFFAINKPCTSSRLSLLASIILI